MVSRLHIVLLLALAAILFGARVDALRGVGAIHSGVTHYATECSFENIDMIDISVGCLPDTLKRLVAPALYVVVGFLTVFFVSQPKPLFSRHIGDFSAARPLLVWGLASGVIAQPPDAHNKKDTVSETAFA
jgi:hypothetical protein